MRNYFLYPELSYTLSHLIPTTMGSKSTAILSLQVRNGLAEVKAQPRAYTGGSWGLRSPREHGFSIVAEAAGDDTWTRDRPYRPAHQSVPWAATPQRVEPAANQAASCWQL